MRHAAPCSGVAASSLGIRNMGHPTGIVRGGRAAVAGIIPTRRRGRRSCCSFCIFALPGGISFSLIAVAVGVLAKFAERGQLQLFQFTRVNVGVPRRRFVSEWQFRQAPHFLGDKRGQAQVDWEIVVFVLGIRAFHQHPPHLKALGRCHSPGHSHSS